MPSWNIHTAHVERLLAEAPAAELGIADENEFFFGNLLPDVYVGYMVSPITKKIAYKDTHFADPGFIPAPDASLFYRQYVCARPHDSLTLGAWCHLLCDHYYNLRTTEFIARIGVEPGEQTRVRKQADFDLFGRTLDISRVPHETAGLVAACEAFGQYAVAAPDVHAAILAERAVIDKNRTEHVETPVYDLLTPVFFASTYAEVDEALRSALVAHASGEDASRWGGYAS